MTKGLQPPSKGKILVVDDEANIVAGLTYALHKEGYRTVTAADGGRAVELARRERPDLVILDWMLPGMDGLEVCRALKADPQIRATPVIMLTVRSQETDKIVGLEMGADDFVTKPFSPRELIARVKAILRRTQAVPAANELFELQGLRVDWAKHSATLNGKAVALTSKEFELLRVLVQARGRVLSREELLDKAWGYERSLELETRTVDLHVSQLRRKLRGLAGRLLTIKNAGYRFVIDD